MTEQHKVGGLKAKAKLLAKNPNYYRDMSMRGWEKSKEARHPGFGALSPEKHREASAKGGRISKRRPSEE